MTQIPADQALQSGLIQRDDSERRLTRRRSGLKLVCFQVEREHYALPIDRVKRITDLSGTYGLLSTGSSLMDSKGESLTLINLPSLLHTVSQPVSQMVSDATSAVGAYVIVCQIASQELIGIPVEQIPRIHLVPETALHPLPELYRKSLRSDCVRALVRLPMAPPRQLELLYLDLERIG